METEKHILFASRHAYMYYQSVSEAFQAYTLSFTQNGKQAVDYLKKHTPSVVILGENLKELNTLKLCKAIRKSSRLSSTKIMLLVPDHTDLNSISEETTQIVDIVLRHTQKPSTFVTHIGKLLKAAESSEEATLQSQDKKEAEVVKESNASTNTDDHEELIVVQDRQNLKTPEQPQPSELSAQQSITDDSASSSIASDSSITSQQSMAPTKAHNLPKVAVPQEFLPKSPSSTTMKPIAGNNFNTNAAINDAVSEVQDINSTETYSDWHNSWDDESNNSLSDSISNSDSKLESKTITNNQTDALKKELVGSRQETTPNTIQYTAPDNLPENDSINSVNEPIVFSVNGVPNSNSVPSSNTALNPAGELEEASHNLQIEEANETAPNSNLYFNGNYQSPEETSTKTIAIIEDNASIAFLEKSILERQGYNTIQIADAPQAREFVDTNFDMADLILLDLNLPGGSGFEILRRIRSFSRKPVIIVSGLKQSENIKRGLSLGAQDYLTKPMNPQELILRVSQHIKNFG